LIDFDSKIPFENRENDILTVGELVIDMVYEEQVTLSQPCTYKQFFGGSAANVAINSKQLGIRAMVAAAVGKDNLGDYLLNYLAKACLDTSFIQRVDESTSMVILNKSQGTPTPIFYRMADYQLNYTQTLAQTVARSNVLHVSCWPISMEPARNTVEKMITLAKENHVLISFDPNFHSLIWNPKESKAESLAYIKTMIQKVDIIKPSEDDAERIFGKGKPERQIEKFLQLGARLVIMTLGKDGVIASNGSELLRFPTLATEVVNTTGAGDAFWSGFYAGIIKGYTIQDSITFGGMASAYKLKSISTVADLPKLERLMELYHIKHGEVIA